MSEKEFLLKWIEAAIDRMGGISYILVLIKDNLLDLCSDEPVKFFAASAPQAKAPDEFKDGVVAFLTSLAEKIDQPFLKAALESMIRAMIPAVLDYLYDMLLQRTSPAMKATALGAAAHAELFGTT